MSFNDDMAAAINAEAEAVAVLADEVRNGEAASLLRQAERLLQKAAQWMKS